MLQNREDEGVLRRMLRRAESALERARQEWLYWVASARAFQVVLDRTGARKMHVETFLRDMADYCYAHKTTAHKDPYAMGVAEGRRQAYLRMLHKASLTDRESYAIYHGRTFEP